MSASSFSLNLYRVSKYSVSSSLCKTGLNGGSSSTLTSLKKGWLMISLISFEPSRSSGLIVSNLLIKSIAFFDNSKSSSI